MKIPDDMSDLSSIDYPRKFGQAMPVFLSSEEEDNILPKHNYNRFSKAQLSTPEIPRGIPQKSHHNTSIPTESPPMFRGRRASSRDRRSNNSAEKITDRFEENRSFEIPDQFRNDPEFMKSISYGRKPADHHFVKLPDVTTFSEFENPYKKKIRKPTENGFSVDTIPSDITSKAIHSLFGDCKLNSQNLAEFQRQLRSKDSDNLNLQNALREKTNELNKMKAVIDEQKDRKGSSEKQDFDHYTSERRSSDGHSSELERLRIELAEAKRNEDYYKRLSLEQQERGVPQTFYQDKNDNRSASSLHNSFEKMTVKDNQNRPEFNEKKNTMMFNTENQDLKPESGPDFARKLLSTLNEKLSSHKPFDPGFASSLGKSQKTTRLDFLYFDDCEDQNDDANATMRPAFSPQEATTELYGMLKQLFDAKYGELSRLVAEYGQTDPAFGRSKFNELQEKIRSLTQQVDHDANMIYLLNDIATSADLHLPSHNR